jgi:2-polyprenyl-3-methyl-5-hydroxy-6-metoxy-1,4-benzoquinol methylase
MIRRVAWRAEPERGELAALRGISTLDGRRVLELGCGDGRLTYQYAPVAAFVLAVDTDEGRIAEALEARPAELAGHVRFEAVGAADIDAPRGSFDVALFSSSL